MDLVRRLLGPRRDRARTDSSPVDAAAVPTAREDPAGAAQAGHLAEPARADGPLPIPCPSCAVLLDPPPERSRRCPRCREPIVVRHVDGRTVLLTEAAVSVFDAERQRSADEASWSAARDGWLRLARDRGASPDRRRRLAAAPISADVARRSRDLYVSAADRAARGATREKRWGEVGQIRREQAAALYRDAGSPVPPSPDVVDLHRAGMTAVLRSIAPATTHAELVSAGCCAACRRDEGAVVRISEEVRRGRLPHEGCPKGLCACDWWPAVPPPTRRRRARGMHAG